MATPGRNAPCPCGSGRKYKHCCGRTNAASLAYTTEDRQAALDALGQFASRAEFDELAEFATDHFWDDLLDDADPDAKEFADSPTFEFALFAFMAVDMSHDLDEPEGPNLVERFLATERARLAPVQRRFLEDLATTWVGLYQVEQVRPGEGLTLLDLWTDERIDVRERSGSEQLTPHELLAARLVPHPSGHVELNGDVWRFAPRHKQALLAALRECAADLGVADGAEPRRLGHWFAPQFHHFWWDLNVNPPMPKMVTSSGQPFELHRVKFQLRDPAAATRALDACRELFRPPEDDTLEWRWLADPDAEMTTTLGRLELEGDVLLLETMSAERSRHGRALIEAACGDLIVGSSQFVESAADLIRQAHRDRSDDPKPAPVDSPEAQELLANFLDQHYRSWPDIALPALQGRTPREAAADPALVETLVDMLHDFETSEEHKRRAGQPAYDFGWLWQELGLADRR